MHRTPVQHLIGFSVRHAPFVVLATFAATLVFAWFALKVRINPDFSSLLPQNLKATELLKEYGGDSVKADVLVFAATADGPGGVFSAAPLAAYAEAVSAIAVLPGIHSTISPFNLVSFGREDGRLAIRPMSPGGAAPPADGIGAFRARLADTRYARNLVVSEDGAMLISYFQTDSLGDFKDFMDRVNEIAARARARGLTPYFTGGIPTSVQTGYYLGRDMGRLLVLAAIIIILCYVAGFRSLRGIVLPMISILFGTLWTIGFMGIMGFPLSLISVVAPPLILVFGNEYNIYATSDLLRRGRQMGAPAGWIERASLHVAKPIAMAFLTTVVGFLSLLVTEIRQTREFAVTAGFGSLSCAFLALFFLPALFALMRPPAHRPHAPHAALPRLMRALARFAFRHPGAIFAGLGAIVVLFAMTWRLLVFNTDSGSYYPQNDKVLRDTYAIYARAGGYEQISVSFDAPGRRPGYFLDADVLAKVEATERALLALPDITYSLSLPDLLREINRAVSGEDALPRNRALITVFSRLLATAGASSTGGSVLGNLSNNDFSRLTLSFRIYNAATGRYMNEAGFRALLARMNATLAANPVGAAPVIWGDLVRILSFADTLRRSLFISMAISVVSILVLTVFVFRSFLFGVYPLVPLATGLLLNFSMMALVGIPLDLTTIMVSNIAIGVGVDSAIYLVIQYRRELARTPRDPSTALTETLAVMGQPIVLSSLSMIAGLLVFVTAAFRPVMYFGILVLFTLLATLVGTLVTLPSLLAVDTRARLAMLGRRHGRASTSK